MASYPNVEAIARAWLAADLNTGVPGSDRIRVENEIPGNLAYTARIVTVSDIGGPGDTQLTLDQADLAVDVYAGSREAARSLAEQVRAALRLRFRRHTDPATGLFVSDVRTLGRPAPTPYPTAGRMARVSATYRVWAHTADLS